MHEKDPTKYKLIFVIPCSNLETFKGESGLDIKQYVMFDDPVTNIDLLKTAKRKTKKARRYVRATESQKKRHKR